MMKQRSRGRQNGVGEETDGTTLRLRSGQAGQLRELITEGREERKETNDILAQRRRGAGTRRTAGFQILTPDTRNLSARGSLPTSGGNAEHWADEDAVVKNGMLKGRWTKYAVILTVGFFGLVAQALLFRQFLTVFEGNELSIGIFFSSWLLWIAAGALVGRKRLWARLSGHFEFLPLVYLPAYVLQGWLINHARSFAGVEPYELFPLVKMLPVSFLVNAPVSLWTGLLFVLACRWISEGRGVPVSRVYVWEAVGSFVGGIAVTLLLSLGVGGETVFLIAALVIASAFCVFRLSRRRYISAVVTVLIVMLAWGSGLNHAWERANNLLSWERLLPRETYRGTFVTPQAKYLYGQYRGQFNVVTRESIADSIPNTEHASEVLAVHLAQHPEARRFLIAGPGSFSICRRLLLLPQAESITWLDMDPAYPPNLLSVLPAEFRAGADRLTIPQTEMRRYLSDRGREYDLIILNMPDATTLTLNRYFTREFFLLLKERLRESGIIGVRVSGGENYMGDELINAGASVFCTMDSVFDQVVLKPGDETWMIASDGHDLSVSPAVLRDRFQAIAEAEAVYPPDGLMSRYLPDRIEDQLAHYRAAIETFPEEMLLNTDRHPKALFHSLLFASREAGTAASLAAGIRRFAGSGVLILPLGICVYLLLRVVYLARSRGRNDAEAVGHGVRPFDHYFLIFATGAVGMTVSIILMFMYQSVFGSLFLHVGLISALFMFGLSVSSMVCERILAVREKLLEYLLPLGVLLYVIFIAALYVMPAQPSQVLFITLFLLSGSLAGLYVPIVARQLKLAGLAHEESGAFLELNDHLGGALGGLMTGLVLLPIFGTSCALGVAALLLVAGFLPYLIERFCVNGRALMRDRFHSRVRAVAYVMSGIAVFFMAASLILHRDGADSIKRRVLAAAQAMAGAAELVTERHSLSDGRALDYFVIQNKSESAEAYIFSTQKLAPDVRGYGGPIIMAVMVDTNGVIGDFTVIESNETSAYLYDMLASWTRKLIGKNLFGSNPLAGVDSVTGATMSSSAIALTLRKAGQSFAAEVLGLESEVSEPPSTWLPDGGLVLVVVLAGVVLVLRRKPSIRVRRLFLVTVLVLAGLRLNMQYSMAQALSLLSLKLPPAGWNAPFMFVLLLPAFVLMFGNIYCGYLCPFGALQELVGELSRLPEWASRRLQHLLPGWGSHLPKADPDKKTWRYGRLVKFGLLFILVMSYAANLNPGLASSDPLVTVFGIGKSRFVLAIVAVVLVLSFFYKRFWCRNLCPAGAFLSLLNGVHFLKRHIPGINHKRCDFGMTDNGELDCLCCDCCRSSAASLIVGSPPVPDTVTQKRLNILFLVLVSAVGLVFLRETMLTFRMSRASESSRLASTTQSGGRPRDVDMQKLQSLIEQRKLSMHEAAYYRKLTDISSGESGP